MSDEAQTAYAPAATQRDLLFRWLGRLRLAQFGHYAAAASLRRWTYALGIPVVVLSAAVGTSVFASLSADEGLSIAVRTALASLSVLAAILAGLQTFFGFAERGEKHRSVAARYGVVRREVEALLAGPGGPIPAETMDRIRGAIDALAVDAPHLSDGLMARAKTRAGMSDGADQALSDST